MKTWSEVRCPPCDRCKLRGAYSVTWDAAFCPKCDLWIERQCGACKGSSHKDCYYSCWNRPEKPSEVKD